jgi:heat shock protein HtpX
MPLTFIDIERRKSWRIGILFIVLVLLYFVVNLAVYAILYSFIHFSLFDFSGGIIPEISHLLVVFAFSLIIAIIHFSTSTYSAVKYVKKDLGALNPDSEDGIHRQLMNILDEIHVVSGNKVKISGLVIPTLSLNAMSMVDLKGNAVIAITEGLLSRISRAQLEAVMAHEAYHILSGDCLETTVASTLFGIPSSVMENIKRVYSEPSRLYDPRIAIPAFMLFIIIWILVNLGHLLNLFISREREYRADAGAVRMSRNPLALAEVLYFLSRNRGGAKFIGEGLENLCIVSPAARRLEEKESWFSDLFSTHPPIRKRIRVLLNMARSSISELGKRWEKTVSVDERKPAHELFYALDGKYMWQGPFPLAELLALPWLSTMTWVSGGGKEVNKASEIPLLNSFFSHRVREEGENPSGYICHTCRTPLEKRSYEKTSVHQCRYCGGILVDDSRIPRIIARKSVRYSERIRALARATQSENQKRPYGWKRKTADLKVVPLLDCPKCGNRMRRVYYTYAYLVEVDRCSLCGVTWFEHDELEILQCLIDNRMAKGLFRTSGRVEKMARTAERPDSKE